MEEEEEGMINTVTKQWKKKNSTQELVLNA